MNEISKFDFNDACTRNSTWTYLKIFAYTDDEINNNIEFHKLDTRVSVSFFVSVDLENNPMLNIFKTYKFLFVDF